MKKTGDFDHGLTNLLSFVCYKTTVENLTFNSFGRHHFNKSHIYYQLMSIRHFCEELKIYIF